MRIRLAPVLVTLLAGIGTAYAVSPSVHLEDMDKSANACTDFYQYANGSWRAKNPIPPSMSRWSRRWQAGEESKSELKGILEAVGERHDWRRGSPEQLIGDFYGACMDEKHIDQVGFAPVTPLLKEIDAARTPAQLQSVIRHLESFGVLAPVAVRSTPDVHDPSQTIADIVTAGLGMPDRDYYLRPESRFKEARAKYLAHVSKMLELAGAPASQAQHDAQRVFRMEKAFALASLDNVSLRNPAATDHKMSFAALTSLAPAFDWKSYFTDAVIPKGALNVDEPKFLREVSRALQQTPLADWRVYLRWHFLHASAEGLSRPFVEENFAFYEAYLGGAKELKPRWKRCAEDTDRLLGDALGQKYVEKYFPPPAKERARQMVANIIAAMHDTLSGLTWMSPQTKEQALAKLASLQPNIGYPDKWKSYAGLDIVPDNYWSDLLAANTWNVSDDRGLIGKPTERGRFEETPPTSDASYNPQLNAIFFPAGILQPPAFDAKAVDAVNYGGIGVVIGHEISHGFDDQGAQFDAQGRLRNWWTAEDLKRFHERTACVAHQFDGYFIEPGIHHNGQLVLGESIADLAGVRVSFLAFHKAQQQHPAPTVDGLTPDQQFFIAWGQWRGDEIRPEEQRRMVQGDPHPIAKYRVVGPLSNLTEFARAFSCKTGAAMVRTGTQRCEVW
jgi:endothelin-converting enzyme/putative endopeptidase